MTGRQSTSIEPIFVCANQTPDMAEDLIADVPILEKGLSSTANVSNVATIEGGVKSPEEKAARERHEKWTCRQTFEVVLKGYLPKLYGARAMDQTLLRPLRYCEAS